MWSLNELNFVVSIILYFDLSNKLKGLCWVFKVLKNLFWVFSWFIKNEVVFK